MIKLNDIVAEFATIPSRAVQPLLGVVVRSMLRRHPALFDRLGEHQTKTFAFLPVGFPYAILACPASKEVRLAERAAAGEAAGGADVSVCGNIVLLLALMEGRIDGDAMFFSRDLTITGDMEAIVALRNAIDDCGIDLPRDLSPLAGPFAKAFIAVGDRVRSRALSQAGERRWN